MGIFISTKSQIIKRIALGLSIIAFFAFSPILLSMAGAWLFEWFTNGPCHEGNCFWSAIGWFVGISFPIAILLLVIFVFLVTLDLINLKQQSKKKVLEA